MQLGRVIGTLVASTKVVGLEGTRFLIVQPLDREERDSGSPVVAADALATAAPGQLVYVVASREAALALDPSFVPVDHAIVGLVDEVHLDAAGAPESGKDEADG